MSFSPSNQPFKDDIELKSDLRSDTLETRQEYDLKVSPHRRTLFKSKQEVDRMQTKQLLLLKNTQPTERGYSLKYWDMIKHITFKA